MHIYSCIILFYAVGLVSSAFTKGDVTISCKNSVCIKEGKLVADTKDNKTLVFSIANEDFVSINIKFNGIRLVRMAGNVKGVQVFPNQSHPDRSRFIIQKDPYVSADKTEFKCIFQMLHFTLVDTGKIFKYEVRYLNGGDDGEMLISVNGGPLRCGKNLDSIYEIEGGKNNDSIGFELCGNPKPTVTAQLNNKDVNTQVLTVVENYRYYYTPDLKTAVQEDCGTLLKFIATGYDSVPVVTSTQINVKFVPPTVERVYAQFVSATACTKITWNKIESGNCSAIYQIKYKRNGTDISDSTQLLFLNVCDGFINNITIQAEVLGLKGDFSAPVVPSTDPPPPTKPPTIVPVSTEKSGRKKSPLNIIIPVVVVIIVIILIVIIAILVIRKKKGKKISSKTAAADQTRPKYDQVQIQKAAHSRDVEGDYAELNSLEAARRPDQSQMVYAELGPGGGRTGPRPVPEQSNYAQVKTDGVYYPPLQPSNREPPAYAVVSKPNKPIPPRRPFPSDDYDELDDGVVV